MKSNPDKSEALFRNHVLTSNIWSVERYLQFSLGGNNEDILKKTDLINIGYNAVENSYREKNMRGISTPVFSHSISFNIRKLRLLR